MMKNLLGIAIVFASIVSMNCSCTKDSVESSNKLSEQDNEEYASYIYAEFENNNDTKTQPVDKDGKIKGVFVKGDQIWISDGDNYAIGKVVSVDENYVAQIGITDAGINTSSTLYALYPYDSKRKPIVDKEKKKITFPIRSEPADGKFATANICGAVGKGKLVFRNLTSIFQVKSRTKYVKNIKIYGTKIAGWFDADFSSGTPEITASSSKGNSNEINYNFTDTDPKDGPFYFAAAPGVEIAANAVVARYYCTTLEKGTEASGQAYEKKLASDLTTQRCKIYNLGNAVPRNALPAAGRFTVSKDGDVVIFSQGNLYARVSSSTSDGTTTWSGTWKIYDKQYYININSMSALQGGNSNRTATSENKEVDLFAWSRRSVAATNFNPVNVRDLDQEVTTFVEWGTANDMKLSDIQVYRTLTTAEGDYLLYNRKTEHKYFRGRIVSPSRKSPYSSKTYTPEYIRGMFLLPDGFTWPSGMQAQEPTDRYDDKTKNYGYNIILEDFDKLEKAGVVFLPCTGYRKGWTNIDDSNVVYEIDKSGVYWYSDGLTTKTPSGQKKRWVANSLGWNNSDMVTNDDAVNFRRAVRLVSDF